MIAGAWPTVETGPAAASRIRTVTSRNIDAV
jgi:hypothetical protein